MSAIIVLLLASITVALFFLLAFLWGVKSGQFDDSFSPPLRILFEDHPQPADTPPSSSPEDIKPGNNSLKPANRHTVCKLKNSTTTTRP